MRKIIVVVMISLMTTAFNVYAENYAYDKSVILEGRVSSKLVRYPGDKKNSKIYFLQLSKSISVACAPKEEDCQSEPKVTDLQLNLDKKLLDQVAAISANKGQQVKLRGTLFHTDIERVNPYHYTHVLMNVEAVSP